MEQTLATKSYQYLIYSIIFTLLSISISCLFLYVYFIDNTPGIAFLFIAVFFIILVIISLTFTIYEIIRPKAVATYDEKQIVINQKIIIDINKIESINKKHLCNRGVKLSCGSIYLTTSERKYKIPRIKNVNSVYHTIFEILKRRKN